MTVCPIHTAEEIEISEFDLLKPRLADLWDSVFPGDEEAYTSVIVPSLTLDQGEMEKIAGIAFYEERLLFLLMRLRNPRAHIVYITSQPIHPMVIDYYLQLLMGIPASHARARLTLLQALGWQSADSRRDRVRATAPDWPCATVGGVLGNKRCRPCRRRGDRMTTAPYSPHDYKTDLKPVWCPGCGDFAVLNSVYRALADLKCEPHETVIVSGIGCSSRLPGYVDTYGFNSLHGRALPIATGTKLAAPNLHVIAVGGDGDGLAIGGNHFMHAARRNVDIAYFIMDNEIYGLTKGQAAPTTPHGDKTKSTIYGNPEIGIDPCALAISLGASWVGRAFAGDVKGTTELMKEAIKHHGFAFLNVISPCVTWRGDDQMKLLRPLVRAVPADHVRTDREAAMRFTNESDDRLTVGALFSFSRPSLLDEIIDIRERASGVAMPPGREEILGAFA